jgi:hypothetical protein
VAFLLISVFILNSIVFIMPKRLKRVDMLVIILFALVFQQQVDIYLNFKYNLYGFFSHGVDWLSLIPILGLFPAAILIFFNFYPWNNRKRSIIYVFCVTVVLIVFEYFSLLSGYFYYNGWKLWWSVVEYPFLLYINIRFFIFYKSIKDHRLNRHDANSR